MIYSALNYVNKNFYDAKINHEMVDPRIIQSCLIYQYLCETLLNKQVELSEIISQEPDMGLIGPGNGKITSILEKCFKGNYTIEIHAIFHDAFGRFYLKYEKGPGYLYTFSNPFKKLRKCNLLGHLSGLCFWWFKNIT